MTTTENLIKVKTLSKKLASQIIAPEYDMREDSVWSRLFNSLRDEQVKRVGWIVYDSNMQLKNEHGNNVYYASQFLHLVEWEEGQLFWIPSPDKWTAEKQDAGPQLFV